MPSSRRTLLRNQHGPPPHPPKLKQDPASLLEGDPSVATPVNLNQPRHAYIPDIALDNNLLFELLVFLVSAMSLALQYINLYKTVWWLPQSHANYALNFYLIDPYLSVLLLVIMGRRVVYYMIQEAFTWRNHLGCFYWLAQVINLVIVAVLVSSFFFSMYRVVVRHSLLYSLFLCYPLLTYIVLFGVQMRPLFGNTPPPPIQDKQGTPKHKPLTKEASHSEIPQHVCSMSPETVREEVEYFKTDFNNRIKQVLFNSMLVAYYMGFVPLCFAQNTVYYDTWWVGQHVCLVWVSSFVLLMVHFLPPKYVDVLHRCSLHLGKWVKVEGRHAHVPYNAWSELQVWQQGALVKHVKGLFKAEGINNSAEPGNAMHARFYFMFQQPLRVINWLLILTLALISYQFLLLLQAMEWSHIVSLTLLMFVNYYVLFRLLRDRWLLLRSYKDENLQFSN